MGKDTEPYNQIRQIIAQAVLPPVIKELDRVIKNDLHFAHYTSSETAFNIIENKSILLRNVRLMNDYSEIGAGIKAIELAFGGTDHFSGEFWHKAQSIHPNINHKFYTSLATHYETLLHDTYISCLSEFSINGGCYGKLSMWRAYGYPNGVAIVLDREAILSNNMTIDVTTYPALYTDHGKTVCSKLSEMIVGTTEIIDKFNDYDVDDIVEALVDVMLHFAVCIKNFNFKEEAEWRAVFRPNVYSFEKTTFQSIVINGHPQKVRKIDLGDTASIRLIDILKKVVIGPTEHPEISRDAFINHLKENGFPDPDLKVEIARIPFR